MLLQNGRGQSRLTGSTDAIRAGSAWRRLRSCRSSIRGSDFSRRPKRLACSHSTDLLTRERNLGCALVHAGLERRNKPVLCDHTLPPFSMQPWQTPYSGITAHEFLFSTILCERPCGRPGYTSVERCDGLNRT